MSKDKQGNLYKQNTDLAIVGLFIPYLTHKTFLDIGAENGEFTRFFADQGLKGIFFEPLPQCADDLSKLAATTGCTFSSYAIDAEDRTADFYHAFDKSDNDAQYFSSLHPLENDNRIQHKKVCTVQCKSLDSLLKEGFIEQSLGVIKVDTEGNDLNVLKGMNNIKSEVLMCEYFMPQIYAGWELGHPHGLIEQAKKIGFNHFIAIKRIDHFEFISLDSDAFIDKQWGNLIFISDTIYEKAYSIVKQFVNQKESAVIDQVVARVSLLQNACDERLSMIQLLKNECDKRDDIVAKQSLEILKLKKLCGERISINERFFSYRSFIKSLIKKTALYKLFRT